MYLAKKVLSLFFTAGLLMTLNGCQKNEDITGQQVVERKTGTILSLGSTLPSQGSHLLQLDDGNTIFLKAGEVNLDDPRYKEKKVEVSGVIYYRNNDKATMDVQGVKVLDSLQNEPSTATTWQEYVDDEKGFSLRYRDDSIISNHTPTANSVTFDLGGPEVTITLLEAKNESEFLDFLQIKSFQEADLLSAGFSASKVGKANLNAYRKTRDLKDAANYYVDGKTRYYHISYLMNESNTPERSNVFDEMLNSFALTAGPTTREENSPAPAQAPEESTTLEPGKKPESPTVEKPAEPEEATLPKQPEKYDMFASEGFKFKILYPKQWYYNMGQTSDPDVLRHYDFGPKGEEQRVGLDLYTGTIPAGTTTASDSKKITKVTQGASVELYVEGVGSRVYRLTGPSSEAETLMDMAMSLSMNSEQ